MTSASAFHFESLVWDWPIAIYLFLIGISAGLVTLAILLRRFHPEAGGSDSTLLRTTLVLGRGNYPRFADSGVPPDASMDFLETDVPLQLHLGDVDGVMLFQLYMVVLVLWLAKSLKRGNCPATAVRAATDDCVKTPDANHAVPSRLRR